MESSYRTYEEWKQKLLNLLWCQYDWFLPYLWGMETFVDDTGVIQIIRSYRTYEEWKLLSFLSTPGMRLGFLPYLWGMETSVRSEP